jgi:hypothetical protein
LSYGWVTLRDEPMIVSCISNMIALKVSFIWMTQLSDSTFYESIDEPLFSFIPQRRISIRRWPPTRFRKFRCILIRSVVFRIVQNYRRDRDHHFIHVRNKSLPTEVFH